MEVLNYFPAREEILREVLVSGDQTKHWAMNLNAKMVQMGIEVSSFMLSLRSVHVGCNIVTHTVAISQRRHEEPTLGLEVK